MDGTSLQYGPQYYFRHPYTTHYLHAKFTKKCTLKILNPLFIYGQRMNKSTTFKAIKVWCSLITSFTSFTKVFMMTQGSASNLSEICPHENSIHVKLALTHVTPCVVCTPHCQLMLLECLTYLDPCIFMDGSLISCPYTVLLNRRQLLTLILFLSSCLSFNSIHLWCNGSYPFLQDLQVSQPATVTWWYPHPHVE